MGCLPVRGDNPRALASVLSFVHVDKHGITILYHLHQCKLDLANNEIFHDKVGKGGIKKILLSQSNQILDRSYKKNLEHLR